MPSIPFPGNNKLVCPKDGKTQVSKKIVFNIRRVVLIITHNGQGLLLCWYFIMSSPVPLLLEKLMMKITTKADRIPSAGYGLIAI